MARSAFCTTHCVCVHVVVRRSYMQRADGSRGNMASNRYGNAKKPNTEKSVNVSKEPHVHRLLP